MKEKVKLFGKEVVLDKLLIITLDGKFDPKMIINNFEYDRLVYDHCFKGINAFYYKDLCQYIHNKYDVIVTPLTSELSSLTMEMGYDIIVQSGNEYVVFSDLVSGCTEDSFGREIRETQNWEKMLYSGCFNLNIPDWR